MNPVLATEWAIEELPLGGKDLLINGEVFPWHIHIDGPRWKKDLPGGWDVLWVPIVFQRPGVRHRKGCGHLCDRPVRDVIRGRTG